MTRASIQRELPRALAQFEKVLLIRTALSATVAVGSGSVEECAYGQASFDTASILCKLGRHSEASQPAWQSEQILRRHLGPNRPTTKKAMTMVSVIAAHDLAT